MRKNGTLTQAEEAAVSKAIDIMEAWLDAHRDDEETPYGFYDLEAAVRDLSQNAWCMCNQE